MNSLGKRLLARITQRVFVFTLLWIGFVCAISFMETPLKFQAPSLTLPVALEIGHLVFHALNALEIGFASAITAITLIKDWPRRIRALTLLIALLLATQTILLYTVLDARTLAIIHGLEVPARSFHPYYIALEGVKLVLLLYLASLQLEEYDARIRRSAQVAPETAND